MGLALTYQTDSGATATYFRVQTVAIYYGDKTLDVAVFGYIDKSAREDGKSHLYVWTNRIAFADLGENIVDPTRAQIYAYLKTLDFFAGATDV